MRKKEQVTLGDYDYVITQLPFQTSRTLLLRLTNLLGPAIGEAVKGDSDGVVVDAGSIGEAVKTLALNLNEKDFGEVQDKLLAHVVWVNNQGHEIPLKGIDLDEHFVGGSGLARLVKLVAFSLKVNYSDFLAEIGLAGLATAVVPQGSPQN